MTAVNFLHLSDFHQGTELGGRLWPSISRSFYDDIDEITRKVGEPWDLVFFTGDLTQKGSPEEFTALDSTLEKLWNYFEKLGSKPLLLPVPGNHDLVRPAATAPMTRAFANWTNDPIIKQEFWKSGENEYIKFIQHAFSAYTNWLKSNPYIPKGLKLGLLPGDFSYSYSKEDVQIGIVGLNSAFLQLSDDISEGALDLDVRQLIAVCGDPQEWTAQQHVSLLLTHHPHSWLSASQKTSYLADILARDRFIAHLFGHMHQPNSEFSRTAGGQTRRWVQGPSLLGLEKFGRFEQFSRTHGYTAGRLVFSDNSAKLCQWPRIATLIGAGYYKFSSDPTFDTGSDGSYSETIAISKAESESQILSEHNKTLQDGECTKFIDIYRRRLSNMFDQWDLQSIGVAQSGGATRPVNARLDEMYVPLRFAVGYDVEKTNRGQYLTVEELLTAKKSVIVRGPAGAGKTTWLRNTFRQMLSNPDALPIMVVLRDLARRWISPNCVGEARSIEAVIQCIFEENVPGTSSRILPCLLGSARPQVVLLIDGWDEVGPLAEELRSKLLGFLQHHPSTLAVVTSRPYGDSQPTGQEGFSVLDLQPLSASDIATLATRFFEYCYGEEVEPAEVRKQKFVESISRSPDSLRLARTPLLLTMMLFISRSRPLPDKRHKLYHECIENLLTALPDAKVEDGALQNRRHWRPDDGEDRLRTIAFLAAALFRKEQQRTGHRSIVASLDELEDLLPAGWPEERYHGFSKRAMRLGFIYWLASAAGLLSERSDGTFVFTHLSFQEYLTAWHLNATVEGEARIAVFSNYMSQFRWREVLRLWAAIIGGQSETRVSAVIDAIGPQSGEGLALAGLMFSDGLGTKDAFNRWSELFIKQLQAFPPRGARDMLASLAGSRQVTRKTALASALEALIDETLTAKWLVYVFIAYPLTGLVRPPSDSVGHDLLNCMSANPEFTERLIARGRILAMFDPLWPGANSPISLLNLWPSRRRTVSYKLQVAAAFGATRSEIVSLCALLADRKKTDIDMSGLILEQTSAFMKAMKSIQDPSLISAFSARQRMLIDCSSWLAAFDNGGDKSQARTRRILDRMLSFFAPIDPNQVSTESNWTLPRTVSFILAILYNQDENIQWFFPDAECGGQDYVDAYPISVGMSASKGLATRATLRGGRGRLLEEASRVSLDPERAPHSLEALVSAYPTTEDPLWLALAKHLARRSDPQDKLLLTRLAANPEEREGVLAWGLKYFVRGDVMLSDGSEVVLDDLFVELGLPSLAYIDELPVAPIGLGVRTASAQSGSLAEADAEVDEIDVFDFDIESDSDGSDELLSEDQRQKRLSTLKFERSVVTAVGWYEIGRKKDAAKSFLDAFRAGISGAGNNLCFMLRRGEVDGLDDVPSADDLLNADASPDFSGFVCVNRALCLASGFQREMDWRKADDSISEIRNSARMRAQLSSIQNWWETLANSGDAEGDLVVGWLVRHGYIDDPSNSTLAERMAKARSMGWAVPVWMEKVWTGW